MVPAKLAWSWRMSEHSLLSMWVKRTRAASKIIAWGMELSWTRPALITATIKKCCKYSVAMNAGHNSYSIASHMPRQPTRRKMQCLVTRTRQHRLNSISQAMAKRLLSRLISLRRRSVRCSSTEKYRILRRMWALVSRAVASKRLYSA